MKEGLFLCLLHKPEKSPGQWWVRLEFHCLCDLCDKEASYFVLEKE